MEFVDAHCHFDFPRFDGCREEEWALARSMGLTQLVVPGVRRKHWERIRDVSRQFPGVSYCLGIHPWYVSEHDEVDLKALSGLLELRPGGCVGVGECGLDRMRGELREQMPWFEAQVALAARYDYPLIIHSVKTHDEVRSELKRLGWSGRALVHGFSGSYQQAKNLVDRGCFIGVGGVITYSRAAKTREAIRQLPLDSLVLETDAPDMAPAGVDKGQNSPAQLPRIMRVLAELRGMELEEIAFALLKNVRRMYGWVNDTGCPRIRE
ncbi:TatD family deoxyribonuclease [Marinobacter salinexigens]|uniref:TatD family deoxyribonuclease n=1 Tax=Marinobacter salinexigens TaxID=2919747 RepID=A0A5B0VEN4_9GAMM|nr:TatD family hydrolase [Marinobacter salinexigens]KAA1173106.1 TatD family deoxyribonuclease [Marinobacter salinexigens]